METHLLSIAIALFAGLMMTRLFKLLHLNFPDVTAYLIAGLLIGPYGIGRLGGGKIGFTDYESVQSLSVISTVALGFIAFSIGNEFRLSALKKTGKQALVIGVARSINIVLENGLVSDTILYGLSNAVAGMNPSVFVILMMFVFIILGFFISSSYLFEYLDSEFEERFLKPDLGCYQN